MIEWSTAAFMFPGQGSQVVGMGKDAADAYPVARQTFEQADEFLGFSLSDLCFNGPADDLNDTLNTQPALYTCSLAILRALQSEIPDVVPGFAAGHSFGEFTALAATSETLPTSRWSVDTPSGHSSYLAIGTAAEIFRPITSNS